MKTCEFEKVDKNAMKRPLLQNKDTKANAYFNARYQLVCLKNGIPKESRSIN